MQQRTLSILLTIAIAITIVAIAVYSYIPPLKLHLVPAKRWPLHLLDAYQDEHVTGNYWVNEEQAHFGCDTPNTDTTYYTCTLNLFFGIDDATKGINLSKYKQLVLNSKYRGDFAKVRVFVRNYNPAYSNENDGNSAKFMSLSLNTSELAENTPVTIKLDRLSIAEWWVDQRVLDRKFMALEYTNITTVGLDFTPYLPGATHLDMDIDEMYFEGPRITEKNWYLGIIIVWITIALAFLSLQFINLLRHNRRYTKQINELALDKNHFQQQTQKYKKLSHLDPLTGVLNRLGLENQLKKLFLLPGNQPISLILLDIDHFKRVNDRRGHDVGDAVLKVLTKIIQSNIRDQDLLARWGGEEFVLLATNVDLKTAFIIAEKIRAIIANSQFQPERPLAITCSFGLTLLHPDEQFDTAFKRADVALYQAKGKGRNCTVVNGTLGKSN